VLAGKFRLIERIGEGATGVVYRALDLELNRAVAVKTLAKLNPDQSVRWRREARAMAAVVHPNLAIIYSADSWNGMPILVVEFLSGGTLSKRLAEGAWCTHDALSLGIALADVIGALHGVGILHGDIKPGNIGFSPDGVPKLLDFGLARAFVLDSLTREQLAGGTPLYLSPEALAGRPPDPSFDLWSVCMVLYEVIAGVNPARDSTVALSLERIRTCAIPELSEFVPHAEPDLCAFFRNAFAPVAASRPRDAAILREQLIQLRRRLAENGSDLLSLRVR